MRFIHVGVGGFGRVWVNALKESKKAEVVALVDVNEEPLAAACEIGEYSRDICYPSLEAALKEVQAEAVVSTTPPRFHEHDVVTAMKAGLHVISEKPMSDSLAACTRMLKTARATGKNYTISQNYRYQPQMWTLAQLIQSGTFGEVGQVKIDFFKGVDFGGGFRHEMPYPVIVDMSIHHFDLIRFITGLDAVSVQGTAWNPPWSNYQGDCSSNAVFEMNNGARVLYNASWCAKGDYSDWNGSWQIECEKGTILYHQGEIQLLEVPELYQVVRQRKARLRKPRRLGQAHVLHEFIRNVKNGGALPATSVEDNIRSVAMVFATVKALETGRKVPVLNAALKKLLS